MEGFGFRAKERNKTALEEIMGCYFVDGEKEIFPNEIGKPLEVWAAGGSVQGIYRGLNEKNFLVFLPSVVGEFLPFSNDKQNEGRTTFRWENKRPKYLAANVFIGASPVRQEYLDGKVRGETQRDLCENEPTEIDYQI